MQPPLDPGGAAGWHVVRASPHSSGRRTICPSADMMDDETLMQAVWSAEDYFGEIIPSPVCHQQDFIWTSESKISKNLQRVNLIFFNILTKILICTSTGSAVWVQSSSFSVQILSKDVTFSVRQLAGLSITASRSDWQSQPTVFRRQQGQVWGPQADFIELDNTG